MTRRGRKPRRCASFCLATLSAVIGQTNLSRSWSVPSLLEVRELVKHFPIKGSRALVQAVNGVTFAVEPGQTLGLIGESGSGKTTVGRCILKLIAPTSGEILFDGNPIGATSE